jgi:flavin-dependent dehydrogenase
MSARIAIVGGGPSGSSLALFLLREGVDPRDIVIYDKATFPRPKLCGGGITFRGTDLLGSLIGRPKGGGETRGLEFRSRLGRFDVREVGPQWVYDRGELDVQLLDAVRAAGVQIREGAQVRAVTPAIAGHRVETQSSKDVHAWVVGADGATSLVRREAGLAGGVVGRLVEGVFEATSANVDPSVLYFDFDPVLDGIPGYAWIFPYPLEGGRGLYKLGIMDGRGVATGDALRAWTLRFAERNGFKSLEPKLHGWPEHYYAPRTRAHKPGILLTGEAYGIDPLLGEGITPAIEISQYAARRLRRAIDGDRIFGYEAGLFFTRPGMNLLYQWQLARMLYGPHAMRWMRVLFSNRTIHGFAGSGRFAYGRMALGSVRLGLSYFTDTLLRGVPSNERVAP